MISIYMLIPRYKLTFLQLQNITLRWPLGSRLWNVLMMTGYAPDKSTADVAADQYHHYKVSIKMLHDHHFAFTVTTN
jgi:hypothetical protein